MKWNFVFISKFYCSQVKKIKSGRHKIQIWNTKKQSAESKLGKAQDKRLRNKKELRKTKKQGKCQRNLTNLLLVLFYLYLISLL